MLDPDQQTPLSIALIGAGTFARDAHVPALLSLGQVVAVRAVYSRTEAAARKLAAHMGDDVTIYTELEPLLARPDIEAVDILLPINVQPAVVEQALAAGKHVISEKPIAPDSRRGAQLLATAAHHPDQVWMVAENLRYEAAYVKAADLISQGVIGRPHTCTWSISAPITPQSKYYHSAWRRAGDFPGGFLLDGGVHHVAVLRKLLGEIESVTAITSQVNPEFPPADTMAATLHFARGTIGTYLVTYAVTWQGEAPLHIAGDAGDMRVYRDRLELANRSGQQTIACQKYDGVEQELAAFVRSVRTGSANLNRPDVALQDVAVIEALLESAQQGHPVSPTRFV